MKTLKIAICQMNPTVGDLDGNAQKILEFYARARHHFSPDIVLFPELCLTGYPPEDLLLRESFVRANLRALKDISRRVGPETLILGYAQPRGGKLYNAAAVLSQGKLLHSYHKQILPNYGVFDEKRYFAEGSASGVVKIKDVPVGLSICEDLWYEKQLGSARNGAKRWINPCVYQARLGAKLLINISASPYYAGKFGVRFDLIRKRVRESGCPMIYVNLVGGQDELVFDGQSMAVDRQGRLVLRADAFKEGISLCKVTLGQGPAILETVSISARAPSEIEEIYQALVLGTRDYVQKNKFETTAIGLSGGIDSALAACIAVDAVGKERVMGITMPSRYSSRGTQTDAGLLARNLGISFKSIPIENIFKAYLKTLAPHFKGTKPNIAEENLQSRIRGTLLMAMSNKFNILVLTTGNKSEISVGYCTLYGDTAGGFAVLKDVPKTLVYQLSEFVNRKAGRAIIPKSTLERAPTAELKFHQKDQDTLPPYALLDRMIKEYVEEDKGFDSLVREGFPQKVLAKVIRMIDSNEYKRRQSPPGVKITPKAFGKDRRMPITNRFYEK